MSTIDFTAVEAKAERMTVAELRHAILDCVKTAEAMDKIDRSEGGDRAGKYRDECSVYRRAMATRHE